MPTPDRRPTPSRVTRLTLTALLSTLVLAGCAQTPTVTSDADAPAGPGPAPQSSAAPSGSPRSSAGPSESTRSSAAPSGSPETPSADSVALPWPAPTAAEAAALQAAVDGGSQPWLLDPTEVAIAYAAAAHGWPDAEAYPGPEGTSVDVRNAEGDRLTLSLAQPARTGDDGIWVVTAER
ncbi:MAG TPA: hypothetical protein VD903_08190 [Pseudonocardia sp.]|nr:hypothetical protein [Pseudonocardia sp.]